MVPTLCGLDDAIRVGGPDEGLWIAVALGDEAFDGSLHLDQRSEHAASEPAFCELGEEALDGIEPRG
ncbi:hypothetical protein ABID43_004562 [Methylobacterium goesingense]|uniref:Uncharacterized protein n=1 Tax=Methylobacterium goesingense TaxID=243690 RepID=A0ABV2LAX6_9HYPH